MALSLGVAVLACYVLVRMFELVTQPPEQRPHIAVLIMACITMLVAALALIMIWGANPAPR